MSDSDEFSVRSPQSKGLALRVNVDCSNLTGSSLTIFIQGVGFKEPADFLPGTIKYYSDSGDGEEPASVFLSTSSMMYSFNAQSSARIIQHMLNSRTLDFKAKVYQAEVTNFFSMPTANLRAQVARYPYCRALFGVTPAPVAVPPSVPGSSNAPGGVGTAGPADVRHPLLYTTRSFSDSAWCRVQKCKLTAKATTPESEMLSTTVVYTYSTKVGTVQVTRFKDGGDVLSVSVKPAAGVWKTLDLQALVAMVTGRHVSLSAVRACAAQRAETHQLDYGSVGGGENAAADSINVAVTCYVPRNSRPVLLMSLDLPI